MESTSLNISSGGNEVVKPVLLKVLLTTLFAVITAVAILGNVMTIAAFVLERSLRRKARNLWIISLSCADLIIGLLVWPLLTIDTGFGHWPLGEAACKFRLFFSNIGITVGIASITAISIDNYLLMSQEYAKYLSIQAHRKTARSIMLSWFGLIMYSTVEIVLWDIRPFAKHEGLNFDYECVSPVKKNPVTSVLTFALFFFIPLIVMTVCSVRFLSLLRRRLEKSQRTPTLANRAPQNSDSEYPSHQQSSPKQKTKSANAGIPVRVSKLQNSEEPLSQSTNYLLVPKTNSTVERISSTEEIQTSHGSPTRGNQKETELDRELRVSSLYSPTRVGKEQSRSLKDLFRVKVLGNDRRFHHRYIRPTITLVVLLSVFAVCNLPYFIFIAVASFFGCVCEEDSIRVTLSQFVFVNSFLNPFLYAATNRKLRNFFMTRLLGNCRKKRSFFVP